MSTNNVRDLTIGMGTYYVDGIRCTSVGVPGDAGANSPFRYSTQPFRPVEQADLPAPPYLVYLDVWERHVTALEDAAIRDVALGGPDTTSRTQVVWQVKTQALAGNDLGKFNVACNDFGRVLEDFRLLLTGARPGLKAKADEPEGVADDPCLSTPDARYRGQENQLYRVEIHDVADDGSATFVWSRENGSVVVPWLTTEGDDLRVAGIRDKVRGFEAGDWAELTHDGLELAERAGPLVRLARAEGEILTMDRTTATGPIASDPSTLPNAKVRRWDQRALPGSPLDGGAVKVVPGTGDDDWTKLEDGIQVQFPAGPWRVGDYWVFPARVATGDIIWPRDDAGESLALAAHGVEHHFAPLAIIRTATGAIIDLRRQFGPLSTCVK